MTIPGEAETGMGIWDHYFNSQTAALIVGLMSTRPNEQGYTDAAMINEAVQLGKIAADAMIAYRTND